MILLLGATGYVGQAFSSELRRRKLSFIPLTRKAIDYTNFDALFDYIRKMKPDFVINAAGYAPNSNLEVCESAHWEALCANALLPQTVARACLMTNTPWGHVSSGNIYAGAKIETQEGQMRIERDLNRSDICKLFARYPERILGFTEWDEPNPSGVRPVIFTAEPRPWPRKQFKASANTISGARELCLMNATMAEICFRNCSNIKKFTIT
jgi:dTDP-4-dehydrorhamnose reductase